MDLEPGFMLHGSRALINMQFRMILISKYNQRLKATSGKLQAMQPEVVWISLIKI